MAVIHHTTMSPTKLELLAGWLPARSWYVRTRSAPELSRAGGFRIDDPAGEVGIEFMVVTDTSGDRPIAYHVPLTYRGAPLDGAEEGLVGTSEHGVLGRRWIYDGVHDPVLVAQLLALLQGKAEAQHQSLSDTPDPSVAAHFTGPALPEPAAARAVVDGPDGTRLAVEPAEGGPLALTVSRVLRAQGPGTAGDSAAQAGTRAHLTAGWTAPDGAERRGLFAVLRAADAG
ncbi:maltokinase N-terminal cap-like domain-containing protein [Streptomyces bambusae]|uniref:1,4-alpha-glucan branching protein n=1 Tax=Streptomyces bambusae TaxID=1550616 RepID=A0ABS6Z691_9ACTN|nr:1,4-alpha-glucan branching protein [Streptomyces bambusae]MBW5483284.1 1,4-alpha-glucan branching protein [Streptomyces bambusae]